MIDTMTTKPFNPFREALPLLRVPLELCQGRIPGTQTYICFAFKYDLLPKYARSHPERVVLINRARAHVERMLGDNTSVGGWLQSNVPAFKTADPSIAHDLMQAFRHRWLSHMADQYDRGEIKL